jgi:hypothetical protein
MNFGISEIDISTFFLIRSRVLHIKSSEIVKREIPLEERFDISTFQDPGSRGDSDLESRVLNYQFAKSRGKENHFGISGFRIPKVLRKMSLGPCI